MIGKIKQTMVNWAIHEFVSGVFQEYFAPAKIEDIQKMAAQGKGWESVSPDMKLRIVRMARQNPKALASITYNDTLNWLKEANPSLLAQMLADQQSRDWLWRLWCEFDALRKEQITPAK